MKMRILQTTKNKQIVVILNKVKNLKCVLAFLLIATAGNLSAQSNNLTLSADETGVSVLHPACKEIRLKPGYRYAANASTNMRSYIDPNMICDVDYTAGFTASQDLPTMPDPSYEVGTTPGSFAVTQTGAAVYNIPLLVSPGTAGMQPNLSVNYNSQGGDGLMGVAWNLGGLSSITRVGGTFYHNPSREQVKGVNLTYSDYFALDGNRLLPYTDFPRYGENGEVYVTELESYSKIISYGVTGNGPTYFIVQAKDGSILEYGNTADSRIEASGKPTVLTWLLNKVTDSQGNYTKFYYYENNATGEYRPSYIEYTGNDGSVANLAPYNKVKFVYGNRQDKQRAYVAGSQVNNNVLLTNVEMYEGANKMHEYSFTYSMDINSHLSEVMEAGVDGKRYNSTKIVWNKSLSKPVTTGTSIGGVDLTHDSTKVISLDVNGDGFTDVITTSDNINWLTYINNGAGYFNNTGTATLPDNDHKEVKFSSVDKISGDFDGDGFDDLVILGLNKGGFLNWNKNEHCKLYFLRAIQNVPNSTDGYYLDLDTSPENTWTEAYIHDDKAQFKYTIGDFDGDGASDLFIYFYDKDRGYIHSFKRKKRFDVFGGNSTNNGDVGDKNIRFTTTDLNGDGKNEVLLSGKLNSQAYEFNYNNSDGSYTFISNPTMIYPTQEYRIYPGDFNGDGKTDLLTWVNTAPYWQVAYSKGDMHTFDVVAAPVSNWGDPEKPMTFHTYLVQDFNGDGKSDIFDKGNPNGGSPTYMSLYYGTGSVERSGGDFIPTVSEYPTNYYSSLPSGPLVGDFNGVGAMVVIFTYEYLKEKHYIGFTGNDWPANNKVSNISDGLCNRTNITYNTLPPLSKAKTLTPAQYTKGTGASYPLNDFQKAITVVSSTNTYHHKFGTFNNNTTYSYSGAKVHLQGKGFLGFTGFKTEVNGFVTEETYNTDNTWLTGHFFQPTLKKSNTSTSAGMPISEKTVNSYVFNSRRNLPLGSFWDYDYSFYASSVTDKDYLHGGIVTTTNTIQDNKYGNVISQIVTNPAGSSTTTNTYEVKAVPWTIKNHLTSSSTTTTRTGEPAYTRSVTIENNGPGGLPSKKTDDIGIVTTYAYNACGLPVTTTVSGTGITTRTSTLEYDAKKRFVLKATNPLGHSAESTYDPLYGNALTQKDANGLITSFAYDGFGRLKETTSPTGTKASSTLAWDFSVGIYRVTSTDASGAYSKQYYDPLARAIKAETNNFDGSVISTTKEYNYLGQLIRATEPNNTGLFTTYEYELDFKRVKKITSPTGTITQYTYNGATTETKITDATGDKISTSTTDASGSVIEASDNAGSVLRYSYHSSGQPSQIVAPQGAVTRITYDAFGRQTQLTDPDAGVTTYNYDILGQLTAQQTAKQKATNPSYSTTLTYDVIGRVVKKIDPQEGTITNAYDPANAKGALASITTTGAPNAFNVNTSYTYDAFTRLISKTEIIPGITVNPVYTYDYDNLSRVTTMGYPSHTGTNSFSVTNTYNANGYLSETRKTSNGSLIWQCNSMNERGQTTKATWGNGLTNEEAFTNLGFLQSQQIKNGSTALVNFAYTFEPTTGNLTSRTGHNGVAESFAYDNLDRLGRASHIDVILQKSILDMSTDYNAQGNIIYKNDVGSYSYGTVMPPAGPHAVTAINNPVAPIPSLTQTITYTAFNKAKSITEGTYAATISYGPDQQRRKMVVTLNGTTQLTKYYVGSYEKIIAGNVTRELHYLGDAVFVRNTTGSTVTDSTYYLHKDHLGSIATVFTPLPGGGGGVVAAKYSYDAWGRRRNYADFTYTLSSSDPLNKNYFDRFYTSHETIPFIGGSGGGLINMNGRMYDPLLGRMLSPDNYVQAGGYSQSYNRYSYCVNNPLKYTDPSGDIALIDDLALGLIGGGINLFSNLGNIHSVGQGLGYFGIGFAGGALSEYITPVGSAALVGAGNAALGGYINNGKVDAGAVIIAGFSSAIMSVATAGISNAVSPYVSKVTDRIISPVLKGAVTRGVVGLGVGALSGAGGAAISGGDIGSGALNGAAWGLGIGIATGAYSGFIDAKAAGQDPWSGKYLKPPAGIPDHWDSKPSEKPGGTVYTNPENSNDFVRDMPGNPNSPSPAQQGPYVIRSDNGTILDVNQTPLPSAKIPEAHIPRSKFIFYQKIKD
jgi:RHS repeat-associated protein